MRLHYSDREEILADPRYMIIFSNADQTSDYQPIIEYEQDLNRSVTFPHGFDREMVPVLQHYWFCLHLPRTLTDVVDVNARVLARGRHLDLPQSIVLIPEHIADSAALPGLTRPPPIAVFGPDELLERGVQIANRLGSPLGFYSTAQLTQATLDQLWAGAARIYEEINGRSWKLLPPPGLGLWDVGAPIALSQQFLIRQLLPDKRIEVPSGMTRLDVVHLGLERRSLLNAIAELEELDTSPADASNLIDGKLAEHLAKIRVPAVVGCSGTSAAQWQRLPARRRRARESGPQTEVTAADRAIEESVIHLAVSHRSLARDGIGLMVKPLPEEAFRTLAKLEDHFLARERSAKFVWRSLEKLGHFVAQAIGEEGDLLFKRSTSVTAFSDFPLGLGILPGDTAPLACCTPVSYRPLTPLTRTLQMESRRLPIYYLRDSLRVLIADCVGDNDPIKKFAAYPWTMIAELVNALPNGRCEILRVHSEAELERALRSSRYDVLLIAAHGVMSANKTAAGIVIDGQLSMGLGIAHPPPLVLMSSCHVSPRGRSAISIADILIRNGAIAVLGTLVPIDALRNSNVFVRLFTYIHETILGREPPGSLEDVWRWVVASNAFHEIIDSSRSLQRWAYDRRKGLDVNTEFKLYRSKGRLRASHIYQDTIEVLEEMATERGFLKTFQAVMKSQGYLPESAFYAFVGSPDRIVLRDETIDHIREQRRTES